MSTIYPTHYTCTDTECSVGTGIETSAANAIDVNSIGIVVIPEFHDNLPVTSVGKFAFRLARNILEVKIEAKIKTIGERSFSDMSGLRIINIPETVTKIDKCGLQFSTEGLSNGTSLIIFEGKSSLESIGEEVFGFRTKVIIKYTKTKSPSCASNAFSRVKTVEIYSPNIFLFCGKYKTKLSVMKTCNKAKNISMNIMSFSIFICFSS